MYCGDKKRFVEHLLYTAFDMLGIGLAFLMFYHTRKNLLVDLDIWYLFGVVVLISLMVSIFTENRRRMEERGYLRELKAVFSYTVLVVVFLLAYMSVFSNGKGDNLTSPGRLVYFGICILISTYLMRLISKRIASRLSVAHTNIFVISDPETVDDFIRDLPKNNHIKGFLMPGFKEDFYLNKPVILSLDELHRFLTATTVDEVFINVDVEDSSFMEYLSYIRLTGITTKINMTEYLKNVKGSLTIKEEDDRVYLTSAIKIASVRQIILKRLMDIVLGIIGTMAMLLIALFILPIVKIQSPGPLFFSQIRIGKNGRRFKIYKFRSMYTDAEERKKELMKHNEMESDLMFKMENDPRIFPFGHVIRKLSLDEFPQFINVLKGDMSVVGTRPPTEDEWKHYELHHMKRMATKPGITGMWQTSGRSNIKDFEQVVELDTEYLENWTLGLDLKIILKTFAVLLKRDGSM